MFELGDEFDLKRPALSPSSPRERKLIAGGRAERASKDDRARDPSFEARKSAHLRMTTELAAPSAVPEHVLDVGGKRRIRIDVVADLAGGETKTHRKAEQIDQLLAGMADE